MSPKLSDDSDDSQPSLMDTEAVSQGSESPINPEINSSSRGNSLTSPSSSTSTSPLPIPYYNNPTSNFNNNNNCKARQTHSHGRLSPQDKINFDSVSSSPEPGIVSFHRDSRISHSQQINVPRTMPCIVLSPSTHQFFNPGLYNPSLIMPLPMFQSHIMGKMSALSSKNTDSGLQRFRDFCADQNSNPHLPTSIKNPYEETMIQKEFDESERLGNISEPAIKRLSFGIDRILSDENSKPDISKQGDAEISTTTTGQSKDSISKRNNSDGSPMLMRQPILHPSHHIQHHHNQNLHQNPHHTHNSASPLNLSRCSECYILGRYCRNNNSLHYSSLASVSATPGGSTNGVSASFSPSWMSNASIYENTPLLSPSAYAHHSQSAYSSAYGLSASGYSTMSSLVSCNTGAGGRRKRSWSRAVFSSLQRKGLEKRFQIQKYITKPDRRQLAATLGLTDAQVKVWFQNRRMKWRHSKEGKVTSGVGDDILVSSASSTTPGTGSVSSSLSDKK